MNGRAHHLVFLCVAAAVLHASAALAKHPVKEMPVYLHLFEVPNEPLPYTLSCFLYTLIW